MEKSLKTVFILLVSLSLGLGIGLATTEALGAAMWSSLLVGISMGAIFFIISFVALKKFY